MNSKSVIAIIVVVIAVVAVIGVAAAGSLSNENNDKVTYYGNGGSVSSDTTALTSTNGTVIINPFSNGDKTFTSWNTNADGTGTKYLVGDSVSMGTSLYAQWVDAFQVTGYSMVGTVVSGLVLNISSDQLGTSTLISGASFTSPATILISGVSNLACSPSPGQFTFYYNETTYFITISITNGTGVSCSVSDNVGKISFSATQDVSVSVTIAPSS